jgi:hypothetical protein
VNASYTESTGSLTSATESLVILGGDADVDRYLQLTRSNLIDQRATQVEMKARAVAHSSTTPSSTVTPARTPTRSTA